ncbi:intracellular protein transport protein USO1-like [Nicotiana sylvestris]|uniref:intracellular protein transport protein USO1-like n=1 Tax=Nicotiana sylvestris TaxID=4096 RepID=UPI00388C5C4E
MHDFIMAKDSKLWDVICDGPYIPTKAVRDLSLTMPKTRKEYTDVDRKVMEKNFRAKKILVCGIGPDEYNRISACETAKEIWKALQTAHEGTTQVKQSKIDMLTTAYELFRMKDDESIQDMHTRFTSIINELHSLGEIIPRNKLVRKILSILPSSWESKVNAITEAKDPQELTIDELVGNLKTHEIKKKIDSERREPKNEKNLVLKVESNDSSEEDSDMAYLTKRFQKMVRRNGGILKRGNSSKPKNYDLCHKCGKPEHFIKDSKRHPVPDKHFKRKRSADNVVKQALAAWGDSSSESEDEIDAGDSSMMEVESEENEYDSIFSLMAQSDDDEDNDNSEVNFRDVQRNQKSYSHKKLISLVSVLIDVYHSLVEDKDALTLELGEAEQTRDDLVVCVDDLKETICELVKEKFVLTEKIANIEHERDDLVVVVVDHKETIENFSKEKEALVKRVTEIEKERDDLLVVIADLRETIEGLGTESKPENSGKGKEVASEAHIRLENKLKAVTTSLCVETEKNKHLQTELKRGIGFQREKTPYNPHSKYVTVPDNWLCTHCGNNGHFKENCQAKVQSIQKNKVFAKNVTSIKGPAYDWKHHGLLFTKSLARKECILWQWKKGLLSVSQTCDKGNKVEFLSKICTITNLVTDEVVLVAKRYKNIYVADFESIQSGDLSCLKAVDDDAELWHKRLGHTSFSLLNKLIQKDPICGLPMSKFKVQKVCDACARGKHVKSSFKSKKDVITSKPLDLLHMDLCGPMRVQSRGGKRYIFVIVDDYSRFTWTMFLRTKDETFEVFVAFVKKIQVKMESRVACIRSNHRTEFDNAKFDEFCSEGPCHLAISFHKKAPNCLSFYLK